MRLALPAPTGGAAPGVFAHQRATSSPPASRGRSEAVTVPHAWVASSLPDLRALPLARLESGARRVLKEDGGDAAEASVSVRRGPMLDGDHVWLRATGVAAPRALPLLRRLHLVRPRTLVPRGRT